MIACIIRYLQDSFPKFSEVSDMFDQKEYIKIAKLNAILRLAHSMDRSHKQKFQQITVSLRKQELKITGETLYDITLERGIFNIHADFFEEVFGIKPVLKQRKKGVSL